MALLELLEDFAALSVEHSAPLKSCLVSVDAGLFLIG